MSSDSAGPKCGARQVPSSSDQAPLRTGTACCRPGKPDLQTTSVQGAAASRLSTPLRPTLPNRTVRSATPMRATPTCAPDSPPAQRAQWPSRQRYPSSVNEAATMQRVTLCPYFGDDVDRAIVEDEHIVPAELGGNLTVGSCSACNRGSAKYVDRPVQRNRLVEIRRARYDVRHVRRRRRRVKLNVVGHDSTGGGRQLGHPSPSGGSLVQARASEPVLVA